MSELSVTYVVVEKTLQAPCPSPRYVRKEGDHLPPREPPDPVFVMAFAAPERVGLPPIRLVVDGATFNRFALYDEVVFMITPRNPR